MLHPVTGPAVSVLANRFGCKRVTIFGSVLASIGFILSYFANDIKVLYLTFGVLGGECFNFLVTVTLYYSFIFICLLKKFNYFVWFIPNVFFYIIFFFLLIYLLFLLFRNWIWIHLSSSNCNCRLLF